MNSTPTHRFVLAAVLCSALGALAHADEGMWPFNRAPKQQIQAKYGFDLTDTWLEHVQKSAVRISSGGSGSLVSPTGLVMTNHHVGSDMLEKLSTKEHDYIASGFHAATPAEEIQCPDIEMHVLWTIEDVTDKVLAGVKPGMSGAEANAAKRTARGQLEKDAKEKSGLHCETVELYQGGRYHLYSYKRYTDVRLVMAPEKGIAFFGGDPDNFEFPRFDLDMCFFRIYEGGKPLHPEHYLRWSKNGVRDNDLVFVAGHPGRTERLFTTEHLEYMRDFSYPLSMRTIWRREVQLATFMGRSEENRRIAEGDYFGIQNTRKARTGIFAGLMDPAIMDAKFAAEKKLRAAVDANPEWKKQWGDGWDMVSRARSTNREFAVRYAALGGGGMGLGGQLFGKAVTLARLAAEKEKPNGERLREFRDTNMEPLKLQLFSPAPIYTELEVENLTAGLQNMVELVGGNDATVKMVLSGKSPRARAEELVLGTKLLDVAERQRVFDGGLDAVKASKDPMIQLAAALDPEARALRKRFEDEVDAPEKLGYAKIAAASFAVNGENQYPDATFTLRLSYGTVKSYTENGKPVAPFTNFAGLYERADERGNKVPFELPSRWAKAKELVNLNTPFNFVSTCDIIGGNSGSPVVDKAGDVVGLIFDGNIQSLVLDIAYEEKEARAVSVDTRAIIESLRKVYGCNALADEIVGKNGG
ncbi:MAG: S46 family peptidase [Planctomycetes bacterium]|nr:S46 family peptidase [Planctomycetota bacterium]